MIWDAIRKQVCPTAPDHRYKAYLTISPVEFVDNGNRICRHWVIGPYVGLKKLAQDLRADPTAQASFSEACFGRRLTDQPPAGPQPSGGFRKAMATALPNPVNLGAIAMRSDPSDRTPRRSDQYDVFRNFYAQKTLEAHHIVEKSILGDLGRNKGDLSNDIAPCVLVMAELHQQIYTAEVSKFRGFFHSGMTSEQQAATLTTIYTDLYAPGQMADLLKIARIIIDQVKLGKPA
jgi:hypothetical protein